MSANAQRGNGPSFEGSMRAYDQLPRSARDALKEAQSNYTCQKLLKLFNAGRYRAPDLVKLVRAWDRQKIAAVRKQERKWGMVRDIPKPSAPRQP